MGVNTLPPGAPRSSSVLGLGQGLRSERVKSLNRRQGLLSRVAFPADRMGIPRGLAGVLSGASMVSVALAWSTGSQTTALVTPGSGSRGPRIQNQRRARILLESRIISPGE